MDESELNFLAGWKLIAVYPEELEVEIQREKEGKYRSGMKMLIRLMEENPERATNAWNRFGSKKCYRVLDALTLAFKYIRDLRDAYYLDAMNDYLSLPVEERSIARLPVLADSLQSRSFHRFANRQHKLYEH